MGSRKLSEDQFKDIAAFAKQWGKIVSRRAFGEDGPGLDIDLDQMEQIAVAAAQGLTAGVLEASTQQQAERLDEQQPCPSCRKMCLPVGSEERPIQVRGGSFEHREPKYHCPACRRDFFPSASDPEADGPRL